MNYIEYQVRVYPNRTEWRKGDKLHREGAPAVEYTDGSKFWYQHGQHHRDDGPAIEYADGNKEWYLNGVKLTEEGFLKRTQPKVDSCEGKIVEIEGKKYRLVSV